MSYLVSLEGDNLILMFNGAQLICYPSGRDVWIDRNASGQLKVVRLGDMLQIRTGTSKLLAYPTGRDIWIVQGSFTPGPDPDPGPGTGTFSWPYEPTPDHWVTSEYGPRNGRFHEGIDMSGGPAVYGSDIPAIGAGTVQQAGANGAFGFSVIINHGTFGGYTLHSLYAHMVTTPPVSVGQTVAKGATIGLVNNTGSSFGSHLHLETHKVPIGQSMRWDNLNPSYSSPRTAINPRNFFNEYGDNTWIKS